MPAYFHNLMLVAVSLVAIASPCWGEVRIKDITEIEGARPNKIYGLGLVVGLDGTGGRSLGTQQMAIDMARKLELQMKLARQSILDNVFTSRNISMVMVTADLPPFARKGSSLDVLVNVLDDAQSLQGGTLVMTPLRGADGVVYAVAQGPLSVGGFRTRSNQQGGQLNHPTVARGPGIANVEKEELGQIDRGGFVRLLLRDPDNTTAKTIAQAINAQYPATARSVDPGTVQVCIPLDRRMEVSDFVGEVGQLKVMPDTIARVVINERTGTVVVGHKVRISAIAIAHGNLVIKPNVTIATTPTPDAANKDQPGSPPDENEDPVDAILKSLKPRKLPDADAPLTLYNVEQTFTVADLARVLNALGVSPRDLIAIFQTLQRSGAMHADLIIM
jgi:flagellar P-ring protein precursor FlgI